MKLIINRATSEKYLRNINNGIVIPKLVYEIKLKNNKKHHNENINEFYEKSKSLKNTINLIKTTGNIMFWGFNKNGFILNDNILDSKDSGSFVFSIDKMKTYDLLIKMNLVLFDKKANYPNLNIKLFSKK